MIHPDRHHGTSYSDTAELNLPELALWLLAELTVRGEDPHTGLPQQARYGALVNPRQRALFLHVFGLDIAAGCKWINVERGLAHHIEPILDAHNWHDPDRPTNRRFHFCGLSLIAPDLEVVLRRDGRGPATVTVIDSPLEDWVHH